LQNIIDADIPKPIYKDAKSKTAIYSVVTGSPMSEARYKKFNPSEKKKFAKNISLFLSQIHNTPIELALKAHVRNTSVSKQNKEIFADVKFIDTFITSREKISVVNFLKRRKLLLKDFKPTLIHGDLTSDNVFVNKKTGNSLGIIDFSDSIISDPARDFAALFSYGENFVRSVLSFYQTTSDSDIYERAQIYYQDMAIKLLALAYKGSKFITKKDAKRLFHQRLKIKKV
jgi:aminoglycoside 2''-phosphotransferase